MHAVCNQGMRERHWEMVAEETGIEVSMESTASLKYLLDNEIMSFLPRIVDVSDTASREWSIEKALGKMLTDWAEISFELAEWKATGACLWVKALACAACRKGRKGQLSVLSKNAVLWHCHLSYYFCPRMLSCAYEARGTCLLQHC
jgi:hypothetical protein